MGTGTYTLERNSRRTKSFRTFTNSFTSRVGGSFGNSEGNAATGTWKAIWRELTLEITDEQHFPANKWLTCLQW